MITYSEAQASAFVTDPGTLKRGQQLARPADWSQLGRTAEAVWGAAAGSGARPYQVSIDLTEPAFKCTCPSRVFPCKHGAGLLLLLARQPELFGDGTPPAWAQEWLEKRQQGQEKKAAKATEAATETPEAAPDAPAGAPEATAAAPTLGPDTKRLARMQAGTDELVAWLEDLLRAGLATLDQQPATFWESPAARLVDNQLPGLAAALRELPALRHTYPDWPARLLARLGELYVLTQAFQRLPELATDARLDVLQQVGFSLKKDDLPGPAVADAWQMLGQHTWDEDRLTARRSWLRGQQTGRLALVLEFAFGGQRFATPLVPNGCYLGELTYYPAALPLRAAPVALRYDGTARQVPAGQSPSELLRGYAQALARQPWLREYPAVLAEVLPTHLPDGRWLLHHATEPGTLPLQVPASYAYWQLLAESGGQPLTVFGEWNGQALRLLGHWMADGAPADEPGQTALTSGTAPAAPVPAATPAGTPAPITTSAATPAAQLPTWPQLLRPALLGTRVSTIALPALPRAAPTPEQQLLLAAGTLALLHKAGYQPAPAQTPPPAAAPAEQLPALGRTGTAVLPRLLAEASLAALLPNYLRQVAEAGRRVPAALLVPLLRYATRTTETARTLAAPVAAVLGRRGEWLAAQLPEWARLLPALAAPEATDTWETAALPERLAWLRARFATHPDEARALLLAALPAEPVKAQVALLDVLAEHPNPTAEPALEALLKGRSTEVRRATARVLVRLPGAALPERLWARAAPLLAAKRKLLGLGQPTLTVQLPPAWDKSWLADGLDEKPSVFQYQSTAPDAPKQGPAAARLGQLLALLPPTRWLAHLGLAADELVAAALASEWPVPLLPAWAQAARLHHDPELAAALLHLRQQQRPQFQRTGADEAIDWPALAELLPPETRQQLLLPLLLANIGPADTTWQYDLPLLPAPWPHALSAAVLGAVLVKLRAGYTYDRRASLLHVLSELLAPRLALPDIPWALAQVADAEVSPAYQPELQLFAETLRLRQEMVASLRE